MIYGAFSPGVDALLLTSDQRRKEPLFLPDPILFVLLHVMSFMTSSSLKYDDLIIVNSFPTQKQKEIDSRYMNSKKNDITKDRNCIENGVVSGKGGGKMGD